MLTKDDLNSIRQLVRETIREEVPPITRKIIKEEVPPIVEAIVERKIKEVVPTMIDEKLATFNKSLMASVNDIVKFHATELKRELQTEMRIEFGKVWEELKFLRATIEVHIQTHNGNNS